MHRWMSCLLALAVPALTQAAEEAPRTRTFRFTYAATLTGLPPGKEVRVWLPVPSDTPEQQVKMIGSDLPAEGVITSEPQFGNRILYLEAKANQEGKLPMKVTYEVKRKELKGAVKPTVMGEEEVGKFLKPDALVPIDGKPLELLKGKELPDDAMGKAKALYELVNNHMKYDKSKPGWGRGDAVWACDSKFGNCTDFHSLFISLARSQKLPAKFEMGFGIPPKRGEGEVGGYHCWAKFRADDKGWVGVDISEANKNPEMKEYYFGNLTEDRVTFSTGRDLTLVPAQKGKPLNFFIYPYAEVDGKPHPAEKVEKKFSYEDVR